MHRLLTLILSIPVLCHAQFTYTFDQTIPVSVDGTELLMPWAGGINSAQYNTLDLNRDGVEDLVVFDRSSDKISTFLAVDGTYTYAPEYETLFPDEINNWLILKDYTCDGRKDIFTSSSLGITTYVQVAGDLPAWQKDADPVNTVGTNGLINLKINVDDLPAIVDMDSDGDLDILTFGFTGAGEVQYHENRSMDNGNCSTLDYKRVTTRWGNFEECSCGTFAFGDDPCPPSGGRTEHVGGKSLLAFDADNDQDYDLIIGEEDCVELHLLENTGSNANPQLNNPVSFPQPSPIAMYHFPTPYLEDVTFDDIPDLLISTNSSYNTQNRINFEKSGWVYANSASTGAPVFEFQQNDFLQSQMIELGQNAVPTFIDVDGDNDLDLLVSMRGLLKQFGTYYSQIYLYENTGTRIAPSFMLQTRDFLNFSTLRLHEAKLQFADMDADGIADLVYTGIPETGFAPIITYLKNTSKSTLNFAGQELAVLTHTLSGFDNPYFFDINGDGFADMLLGKNNGNLEYYKHNGDRENGSFLLEDDTFYGIATSFTKRNIVPSVGDLDDNGQPELITTDATGQLIVYQDFMQHVQNPRPGTTSTYYNTLNESHPDHFLGTSVWIAPADLFSSGMPLLFTGTVQGGIRVLKNTGAAAPGSKQPDELFTIYPNPARSYLNNGKITIRSSRDIAVQLISVPGKKLTGRVSVPEGLTVELPIQNYAAGVYIALIYQNNAIIAHERFIVVR